ncbi:MAG: UDP-2,3-diacylglucosamine diphosphatase [Campylobacteraceae bacterium]|jgi:UDP-2,3-diacylglucosamine hydrolase|nr:UDP-2,3-diacylglucosamine diphosphatase [Campylobacteraceae bacterium]
MSPEIKDGALFVADAHENGTNRAFFSKLLHVIKSGEIPTPQLFLMGDMFDLLVGGAKRTHALFKDEIDALEEIAQKVDVFYFEGNHDFNLDGIFSKVKTVSLKKQPLIFENECGLFGLAHGDLGEKFTYRFYTALIRNPFLIALLNLFDRGGLVSNSVLKRLEKKELCVKMEDFENIAARKILSYQKCDFIVEGHYHQNQMFVSKKCTYINLGAFACGGRVYRFDSKTKPYLKSLIFSERESEF